MLKYKKRSQLFGKNGIPTALLIILELFAIIGGVIIGFMVNEWRENRNNQKIAEIALTNIASEMAYNHNQVVATFTYYKRIFDQVDSLSSANPGALQEMYGYELQGWQGAQPPMLRSSSYQMALMTGIIKDFPYEISNALAQIYNVQSVAEKLDDSMIVLFTTDPGFTKLATIGHLFGVYTEVLPSVMLGYQQGGLPLLRHYGYDLELDEGVLKENVDRYAGFSNFD
jgi:hypothetical protein